MVVRSGAVYIGGLHHLHQVFERHDVVFLAQLMNTAEHLVDVNVCVTLGQERNLDLVRKNRQNNKYDDND